VDNGRVSQSRLDLLSHKCPADCLTEPVHSLDVPATWKLMPVSMSYRIQRILVSLYTMYTPEEVEHGCSHSFFPPGRQWNYKYP